MPASSLRLGFIVAGLLISIPALATPPSDECSKQADHCRDAYDALDSCLRAPGKTVDAAPKESPPPEVKKPVSSEERPKTKQDEKLRHASQPASDKPDVCTAERVNAESVCKSSNSVCTGGGTRRRGHAAKD